LNNAGEKLELSMPGNADDDAEASYIRVDGVSYSDGLHPENCPGGADLWPRSPDSGWSSLSRVSGANHSNDPDSWGSSTPSPGSANP
jgi:hypothetical protein